ncbi:peptidyl-prolyl cis-trans isomerase [Peribacillus sp. SCS-155]|uniref:peptidyl-prolyl cis-trans isomerase n=1 Tax=Peribacillus sedimenti TaxID=3115297 RepID=UPI003906A996
MESIMTIHGKVTFPITLDSGVWIFDDRKVDLNTYFTTKKVARDELEEYTKATSKHWSREIQEGAVFPPTLKTEKKYEKERILTGSFGMPLEPFIKNAAPDANASVLIIETASGEREYSLEEAKQFILGFAKDGKPLKEDGPVHVYFGDGSNAADPITNVRAFRIE